MKYLLLLGLIVGNLHAATFTAASTSRTAVGTAYALCSDGDTLAIPAGTSEWTNTLAITKAITVQGAGIGQTVLKDGILSPTLGTDEALFWFDTTSGKAYRLTGVEFQTGVTRIVKYFGGSVQLTGSSHAIRIDHCKWGEPFTLNRAIVSWNWTYGVADHNSFSMGNATQAFLVWHNTTEDQQYGDGSFTTAVGWGTTNAFYIESNTFTNTAMRSICDALTGARTVIRFNTIVNDYLEQHGLDSGGRYRSVRSLECYGNTFSNTGDPWAYAVEMRGGTGIIYSNTISSGYTLLANLSNYRDFSNPSPFNGSNGTNTWDVNTNGVVTSGTHTGSNGATVLTSSGATWTVNQWIGFILNNTTSGRFSEITANTATTITYIVDSSQGPALTFDNGNAFQVREVIVSMDQAGRGAGDTVAGDTPLNVTAGNIVAWPHQASEPWYQWANVFNGGTGTFAVSSGAHLFQLNRDYFNEVSKPGYTALVFPHPLVGPAPTLVSIAVTPANPSVVDIGTKQFTATGTYSDASTADITTSSVWTSGDTGVATVNSATGLASGVAAGMASITATKSAISGSTTLTVTAPVLASITISPASASIAVGATKQFAATGIYSDGSTQNITASSAWASGNPAIATIGASSGLATGVAVGTISITAIKSDIIGAATLSVATTSIGGKTKLHGRVHMK